MAGKKESSTRGRGGRRTAGGVDPGVLQPDVYGEDVTTFRKALRDRMIGQQPAVDAVTEAFQIYHSGLSSADRPLRASRSVSARPR